MSRRRSIGYTVLDAVAPQGITSSTNASPIEITKASHGYVTGDKILITGHTTNTAANGLWTVTKTGTNTFTLDGSTGNGVGGADGIMLIQPKIIYTDDFRTIKFDVGTTGSSNMTLKIVGSLGKSSTDSSYPNFGAAQSPTNSYDFIEAVTIQDGAYIDGTVGIVTTGTDINKIYEFNTNGLEWVTMYPTAYSSGVITIKARLYDNK